MAVVCILRPWYFSVGTSDYHGAYENITKMFVVSKIIIKNQTKPTTMTRRYHTQQEMKSTTNNIHHSFIDLKSITKIKTTTTNKPKKLEIR